MSTRRCLVGSLVGGIVLFFLGYAIFGVLLAGFFEANRGSATGVNRESIDFVVLAIGLWRRRERYSPDSNGGIW